MAMSMFKVSSALVNSSKNLRCVVRLMEQRNFTTTKVVAMELPNKVQDSKKKKSVKYTEEALKQALNDIRKQGMGIRETCRLYQIPRSTIQDRLSGKRSDKSIIL